MEDLKEPSQTKEPKQSPQPEEPKIVIPPDAPDFQKKAIWINDKHYFPLDFTFKSLQMSSAEFAQNKIIGQEIIKTTNKEIKAGENLYKRNKEIILNKDYLAPFRNELLRRDYQDFIDYLNTINMTRSQKNPLRPNAEIIKKFGTDIKFYKLAISNAKLEFTIR